MHSSLFHLSACAFHNSRLNFVLYLGNKIIVNIKKIGEIIGRLCGKINANRDEPENIPYNLTLGTYFRPIKHAIVRLYGLRKETETQIVP